LLVPGLICDFRIFQGQLVAFPGSAVGDCGDARSIPEMAQRVLASAPERFVLLGHSMGARVALEIYRQAPERVGGLALASTGIHAVRPGEREKRYALRDIGRKQGMAALVDAWLPPMLGEAGSSDPALVERLRGMCIDAGLRRFEGQIEALLSRPEVEDLLPRIVVPTLVAVGSEDQWAPPGQHAAFAALIPCAHFVVIEGAGHMLPAEKPAELNAAIAEWLGTSIAGQEMESKERIND
jgi:pimeloyl-ACP methyl ester carboxylesterase